MFTKRNINITKIETNNYKKLYDVVKNLTNKIDNGYISMDNEHSKLLYQKASINNYTDIITPLFCTFLGVYTNDNP